MREVEAGRAELEDAESLGKDMAGSLRQMEVGGLDWGAKTVSWAGRGETNARLTL